MTGLGISWINANIPAWTTGVGSKFLIRITRTEDAVATAPELFLIQDRRTFSWQSTNWANDGDSYPAGVSSRDKDGEFYDYYFRVSGSTATPPTADIDPTEKTVAGGASSYDITVTSTGDWTAQEALDWLSLSPDSGTGNGTITVTVTPNNSGDDRSGTILIGGNNHSITQTASAFEGSINPLQTNFTANGGNGSVTLTTEHPWIASVGSDSWITITSPTSGTGNATVNYTVVQNTATTARTGTISIESLQHTVQQFGTVLTFDEWLLGYYTSEEIAALSPSAGQADPDEDGLNNNGEFLLQLDPTSLQSRPKIVAENSANGIVISITPQVDGVIYRLNSSVNLTTWTPEPTLTPTIVANQVTFAIPSGSEAFYQLEIEAVTP